jgi:hypothetical protein
MVTSFFRAGEGGWEVRSFGVQPERWFSYPWLQYIIFARQVKLDWQERAAGTISAGSSGCAGRAHLKAADFESFVRVLSRRR